MRLVWAIMWKEWLGLRWKLAALTAILLGPLLGTFVYDATSVPSSLLPLLVFYSAIAPIFLAMHAAAEDNSAGTLEFVRGLPIPLAQWGVVRVLATLAVLLLPVIAAGGFTYVSVAVMSWWRPDTFASYIFGSSEVDLLTVTLVGMTVSASLYLWTTALAMNQPSELRAGLIGVATAVLWGGWTLFSISKWDDSPGSWTWLYGITALGPFASLVLYDPGLTALGRVAIRVVQLAGMCALVVVSASRYGVLERRRWGTRPAFSSPERALWWMHWRQAWPLAIAGPAVVLVFFVVGTALSAGDVPHFRSLLYPLSIILGSGWAILIGTTTFCAELETRLVAFWRSRPIDPAGWFWIKYASGALAVFVFIDLPAAWLGKPSGTLAGESFAAYVACVPAMHLAIYSVTVLVACLVRHTIYAGILSLGATLFFVVVPMFAPRRGFLSGVNVDDLMSQLPQAIETGRADLWLLRLAVYLAFALFVALSAMFLARWVVKNDLAVRA
jgi:hypothetical protein